MVQPIVLPRKTNPWEQLMPNMLNFMVQAKMGQHMADQNQKRRAAREDKLYRERLPTKLAVGGILPQRGGTPRKGYQSVKIDGSIYDMPIPAKPSIYSGSLTDQGYITFDKTTGTIKVDPSIKKKVKETPSQRRAAELQKSKDLADYRKKIAIPTKPRKLDLIASSVNVDLSKPLTQEGSEKILKKIMKMREGQMEALLEFFAIGSRGSARIYNPKTGGFD